VFFIIYTVIYLWILFKILDSIVVVQLDKFSKSSRQLRKELVNLGIKATKGLFMIIGLSVLLNRFGISIAALMSTLGIGGLAFALAAKDSLSNLLGGITLLIDNVFSIGDWIEIGDVEGTAVQIGLRSTTIRTFDNALITIPNSLISVSSVKNWNRRAIGRRIKMYVGVTYESDMNDIRQAVEDIRTMLVEHPEIANPKEQFIGDKRRQFRLTSREDMQGIKSTLLVFVDKYNEFSIDILIYCFSRTVNWAEWLAVKEDVLYKIAEILEQNNLEFAYPTAVRIFRPDQKSQEEDLNVIPGILGQQSLM
jgi:MscS family membrane protein